MARFKHIMKGEIMYNYGNKCSYCGKEIITRYRLTKKSQKSQKYCSRKCLFKGFTPWLRGTKGLVKPNSGSFKKGQVAPNKGKKLPQISGKNHWNWKGGRIIQQGYVCIKMPEYHSANSNGYVQRSHYIMEQKLGRHLKRGEIVHHINEIKTDDRPENLQLLKNISEHNRIHKNFSK